MDQSYIRTWKWRSHSHAKILVIVVQVLYNTDYTKSELDLAFIIKIPDRSDEERQILRSIDTTSKIVQECRVSTEEIVKHLEITIIHSDSWSRGHEGSNKGDALSETGRNFKWTEIAVTALCMHISERCECLTTASAIEQRTTFCHDTWQLKEHV